MRRWTYLIVPALLGIGCGAKGGPAGADAAPAAAPEGTWTGDSRCQVPGSPCRDEKAVYRVLRPRANGKVPIDGGKLVNGKVVSMGVLDFDYDAGDRTLTCKYQQGVLRLTVDGDAMTGTLTTPDGVVYRRISSRKEGK
jgi:hypothetical protein